MYTTAATAYNNEGCRFKEYVSNAPTPQDAMNRQQMLNKFTTSISNMAEELEDIVKKYASMKKEISAVSRQQYNKRQQDKQHTCGSSGTWYIRSILKMLFRIQYIIIINSNI